MPFKACRPDVLRRHLVRTLRFRRLPAEAESDIERALERVPPESQILLIQAAEDAGLEEGPAIERLCCLSVCAASVNLADDLADGDCHYLESRVAPGISFLLQSFAASLAARGDVSIAGLERFWLGLALAAAGQSIEVRTRSWDEQRYREVAQLIAGEQYAAYFRLLWDGTWREGAAIDLGRSVGTIALVHSDLTSHDARFFGMRGHEQRAILAWCQELLATLGSGASPALAAFVALVGPLLEARMAHQTPKPPSR